MLGDYSEEGFVQDYTLGKQQELFIYCRACRSTFPVRFRPRRRSARLRCFCGHEAPLSELDVFRSQREAEAHAELYERVYRAAKDALREAGLPLPPSGKYARVEDVHRDPEFVSFYSGEEDESAIRDGYVTGSESDLSPVALRSGLEAFEERLAACEDVFARHELLSELIEWAFCRRHFDEEIHARFRSACLEDMRLAPKVKEEAKRRKRAGEKVRLSFTSFRHLCLDLEEQEDYAEAARVARAAARFGLRGFRERAERLEARGARGRGERA
ncbi:MAG: hypothetical protein D6731_07000 [Planctomycetota bacterium]|nr:MAG: hypothetical protein D6731_07000 [Planctomycetota bacterium]